jgi:hypothetical protein
MKGLADSQQAADEVETIEAVDIHNTTDKQRRLSIPSMKALHE